ncbi:MAG: bifunctional oligoribonuclease/PAP phosphatase NrnA [Actinobacteria bacterium]|nr:bifunctional oligoribonuclease/PAP phosphatase NrnA [Actinomycetota bacterium]
MNPGIPPTPQAGKMVTPEKVAARLRGEKRVLAITHEAPDGDALGCISAFLLMADRLGLDSRAYVPGFAAFPDEYLFLPRVDGVLRGAPPEVDQETTVYMLDCASLMRSNGHQLAEGAVRVNIDHHQDNPAYGEFNLLDSAAPSTTAILYAVFRAGGFPMDVDIATALYVGLVTDTGRFQYSNTTAEAHRMAAELQNEGVDVNAVYREVYESTPLAKLMLLERALCHLEIRLGGALVVSWLGPDDFAKTGAHEGQAEGIIDTLRRIQGVRVAALIKERSGPEHADCKVSLRSTDGSVNVALMAGKLGGGGHVRAAGFNCEASVGWLMDWVENEVRASP